MSPVWTKVTAELDHEPDDWSVWCEMFERHGVPGTVQTDLPPTISAYLAPGAEAALPKLSRDLSELGAVRVSTELVQEQDWAESWKQFFVPRKIGGIWIRPTWEESQGTPEIVLDPGQAFGTGDHPTTRMCLELLQEWNGVKGSVADIGCGSGILSIAAALLGFGPVSAVDIDPLSVEATRENAVRNGAGVEACCGKGFEPLPPGEKYALVVSNIISAALINLAPEVSARTDAWIVSGIIDSNWSDVESCVNRTGFRVGKVKREGEWVAASLLR